MTAKVKLILGVLGMIALVSVLLVYEQFRSNSVDSVFSPSKTIDFNDTNDQDKDGLSDSEEMLWTSDPFNPDSDGDGFKDGEEVISGHDPMKKGPNDLINSDNATENLASMALGGLLDGSLKSDNPDYEQSVNDMVNGVLGNIKFNKDRVFKVSTIQDTEANRLYYLNKLAPLFGDYIVGFYDELGTLQNNLEIINSKGLSNASLIKYYSQKASMFYGIVDSIEKLKVPTSWKDNHLATLEYVYNLAGASDAIAKGSKDPVKAFAGLNYIGIHLENISAFLDSYDSLAKQQNIDLTTIFKNAR